MVSALYPLSLAALAVAGGYTLHYISFANGNIDMMNAFNEKRVFSDGTTRWPDWLDGPVALMYMPYALLGFFWPLVSGDLAGASWQCVPFAGQTVACWAVLVLEGYRRGVRPTSASYTTVYGQIMQLSGFALLGPLFLVLNLLVSPLVSGPTPENTAVYDERDIKVLPWALTTGYIIPTILMMLPYPSVFSLDSKIIVVLVWQLFPVLVYVSTLLFKPFAASASPSASKSPSSQLPLLRRVYAFALVPAIISHVAAVAISATTYLVPGLFSPDAVVQLSPWNLFVPSLALDKVSIVAEGALKLMKWDYAIGSVAHLVWAYALTAPVRKNRNGLSVFSTGNVLVDIVVRTIIIGPMSAVLTLFWERDEIALGGGQQKKKK